MTLLLSFVLRLTSAVRQLAKLPQQVALCRADQVAAGSRSLSLLLLQAEGHVPQRVFVVSPLPAAPLALVAHVRPNASSMVMLSAALRALVAHVRPNASAMMMLSVALKALEAHAMRSTV